MSVRNGLLALLAEEPRHCYALKAGFEERTGQAWRVNIGQVYSTLERLERDGLVEPTGSGEGAARSYQLTGSGLRQLQEWFAQPVMLDPPPRDELAIKLLLAVGAPQVDVLQLIQRQRAALIRVLQRYTHQKELLDEETELPSVLLHDSLILNAEAQLRWLDLCEARLRRRGLLARPATGTEPAA
ncbi:MAG TPA: PadR family transcriptional regulator [Natronosporangium sp.]